MILIADSGSTKTDWCIVFNGTLIKRIGTKGINPFLSLIHILGGCWNKGVHHEKCGKFAIQLDSDDLYKDEHTIQKIVDTFYKESCAMVIGTYLCLLYTS